MRVGLMVYGDLATLSGGYEYDRQLKARLEGAGDEVEVLSLPARGWGRHVLDNLSGPLLGRVMAARLDVLLQDELCHPSLVLFNRRLRRARGAGGPPVVAVVHHLRCLEPGRAAARRLRRAVERAYLGGVDGVVCNSGHTRGEVARLRPGLLPAVVARPAGDRLGSLDPAAVAARCGEPGPLRLLALGAVVPRKGLLPLLEGLSGLPAAAWRLTVAGRLDADPAHARRVERAARAWPDGQVNFAGRVADEALPDLLAAHQVLALPFSYEGFGIVYAEAMAYGLPCLASTAGGAPEIVGHGATGYLVRPGDLRSLAGHVAGLAGDRALLRRMSLAARQAAGSMPTWADCGRTVRGFLETVAGLRPDRCAFGGTAPAEIFAERTGIGEQ